MSSITIASGTIRGWTTPSSMTARTGRWGRGFAVGRGSVGCSIIRNEPREGYVRPMRHYAYLSAAIAKKKVPVVVVASTDRADFTIKGTAATQKPSWARTLLLGQTNPDAQASITVTNVATDVVAFAYAYHM